MKRTTGGHCDRKGEWVRWKHGPPMHQPPVWGGGGGGRDWKGRGKRLHLQSNFTGNAEALAAEARQETRLVSTSKAWILTRFPSKKSQTFISCMCLPSSIWLWSVLLCSEPPSSVPCWIGAFVKNKVTLYLTYIIPFCFQRDCFSQRWGNFNQRLQRLRLCPGWQQGPWTQCMELVPQRRNTHQLQHRQLSNLFPRTA